MPLLLLGLPALYGALERRGAGRFALAAAVLAVIGFVGMAPGLLVEAFIAPAFGHDAMERFRGTGFGVVGGLPVAWVLSSIPLAVACHRAGFGPRWVRVVLAVVSLALLVGAGVPGAAGGVVVIAATAFYGVAVAVLGWRLRHPRSANPPGGQGGGRSVAAVAEEREPEGDRQHHVAEDDADRQ